MIELAPIVTVSTSGGLLRKQASSITMVLDEPCSWTVQLDNSEGDYNPSASLANPRTYSGYLNIDVDLDSDSWSSPDLVVEDYSYDTDSVTISGRCRLSELDREDQTLGDYEDTTVAAILTDIAGVYGLTVTGAPTRAVRIYHAIGNPLQMFRELLNPTHVFRMGAGNQIVVEPVAGVSGTTSFVDDEHLEVVRFKRTSEIFNKAIVERVYSGGGQQVLADQRKSEGGSLGAGQIVELSSPSRAFTVVEKFGLRGNLVGIQALDASDNVLATLGGNSYVGTTAAAKVRFSYDLNVNAQDGTAYTPEWWVKIVGYPDTVDPPPVEGYSATATAGAGDRPYPEPFTSQTIEDQAAAQAAANAFVEIGTRQGNILDISTRLHPSRIPAPNSTISITDFQSGLSGSWIAEVVNITEDEDSDTGTTGVEATKNEVA